jgi:hypothetical protein
VSYFATCSPIPTPQGNFLISNHYQTTVTNKGKCLGGFLTSSVWNSEGISHKEEELGKGIK